jgi:hypothetical protein
MTQAPLDQQGALIQQLAPLSSDVQEQFVNDLQSTIALGARALVLSHLQKSDAAEFEKVIENGDDAIIAYGLKKIPDFELKWFILLDEIYKKAVQSIKPL